MVCLENPLFIFKPLNRAQSRPASYPFLNYLNLYFFLFIFPINEIFIIVLSKEANPKHLPLSFNIIFPLF